MGGVELGAKRGWALARHERLIGQLDHREETLKQCVLGALLDGVTVEVEHHVIGRDRNRGEETDTDGRGVVSRIEWAARREVRYTTRHKLGEQGQTSVISVYRVGKFQSLGQPTENRSVDRPGFDGDSLYWFPNVPLVVS